MSLPPQKTSSENDGTIIVVGGGPVGLYYIASKHIMHEMRPHRRYTIFTFMRLESNRDPGATLYGKKRQITIIDVGK